MRTQDGSLPSPDEEIFVRKDDGVFESSVSERVATADEIGCTERQRPLFLGVLP
jgi:hypothetical protein